jgi:hypothetical protein
LQVRTTEQIAGSGRYGWTFNGVMRVKPEVPEKPPTKPAPRTPAADSAGREGATS